MTTLPAWRTLGFGSELGIPGLGGGLRPFDGQSRVPGEHFEQMLLLRVLRGVRSAIDDSENSKHRLRPFEREIEG